MDGKARDYYEVLGVPRTADLEEIKRAFRALAKTHHPDRENGNEEKFKEISQAASVLQDPALRATYDRDGFAGVKNAEQSKQAQSHPHPYGHGPHQARPKRVVLVNVTLEEIFSGVDKSVAFEWDKPCGVCRLTGCKPGKHGAKARCRECNGAGVILRVRPIGPGMIQQSAHPCATCDGRGLYISKRDRCLACHGKMFSHTTESVSVRVPAGALHHQKVSPVAANDVVDDHIAFLVEQDKHARFDRQAQHLLTKRSVSLVEALTSVRLGLTGVDRQPLTAHSPPNAVTKPNSIYRLPGHGLPIAGNTATRGDLFVHIEIEFPSSLSLQVQHILKRCLPAPSSEDQPTQVPTASGILPPVLPSMMPKDQKSDNSVEMAPIDKQDAAKIIQLALEQSASSLPRHPHHHMHMHGHQAQCHAQ